MENDKELSLVAPTPEDVEAIKAYQKEFEQAGQLLQGMEDEKRLDEAMQSIPNRTFLYKDGDGNIVGMSNLRLGLNAYLYEQAGHVGYSIRPSEQGKGYGSDLLEATLWMAALAGFEQVMIVCKVDNLASIRMIEKVGGDLFEKEEDLCRYWVMTRRG